MSLLGRLSLLAPARSGCHIGGAIKNLDRFKLMLRRQMSVSKGHRIVAVSQKLAHGVEINTSHHQPRSEVMAHIMPPEILYIGVLQQLSPRCVHPIEPLSRVILENEPFATAGEVNSGVPKLVLSSKCTRPSLVVAASSVLPW